MAKEANPTVALFLFEHSQGTHKGFGMVYSCRLLLKF